jgi:hypothetical protein
VNRPTTLHKINMTNHQTIAITVTGLAELAHSEYQVLYTVYSSPSFSPPLNSIIFIFFVCYSSALLYAVLSGTVRTVPGTPLCSVNCTLLLTVPPPMYCTLCAVHRIFYCVVTIYTVHCTSSAYWYSTLYSHLCAVQCTPQ